MAADARRRCVGGDKLNSMDVDGNPKTAGLLPPPLTSRTTSSDSSWAAPWLSKKPTRPALRSECGVRATTNQVTTALEFWNFL